VLNAVCVRGIFQLSVGKGVGELCVEGRFCLGIG